MKSWSAVCVTFILLSGAAFAQEYQRADIFAGYSYFNADTNGLTSRQSLNGWETSVSVNANRWLAGEGDFSGYYKNNIFGSGVNARDYGYSAGPRFNFRPAFFHVLLGVDHLSGSYAGLSASQNSFAMALGGGVQWKIAPHWGVRASSDWVLTHHNILGGSRVGQNNFRVGVGVVYVFGSVNNQRASLRSPQVPPSENLQSSPPMPGGSVSESAKAQSPEVSAMSQTPIPPAAVPIQPAPTPPVQQSTVDFWSQPTGADVEVDGEYVGSTFSTIALLPGQHTITIRKKDFATWQRTIKVTSGNVRVAAYLEQVRATVTFH
jgi:opacity protein-like surface antigen